MNFQELMNKASANKIVASKQLTKSGRKHKDSEPGISNSAVKAFLERKEQERKKKQADEGAAKRARIEARLRQNLKANQEKKGKSKSTPESLNPPYAQGGEEEEKSIQVKRKKDDVSAQRRKSGALSKPSVSGIKNKDINHKNATTNNIKTKNNERISKEKSSKSKDFVVNEKKDDTSKAKNKSKIASAPQNFKELLAIAEQNKSGLKRKTETVTGKGQVEVEASKVKRRHNSVGAHELAEIDERSMRIKDKCRVKEKAVTKARGKQTESQWKTAVNSDKIKDKLRSRGNEGSDVFKRSRESDTLVQNLFDKKAPKPLSHYAIPREQKNFYAKPKHGYYYDEEEEDSDLDGFIDDGGDETCSDQTDVSKCIKDIFGYDRRRYAMEDDDGFAMESNYGQIEREEKRSAKIAKLEDEIEILKEQAELKRLRDKLKKSKKPKK